MTGGYRELDRCARCGQAVDPGGPRTCDACRVRVREAMAALRRTRAALRRCAYCGITPMRRGLCRRCADMAQARKIARILAAARGGAQ